MSNNPEKLGSPQLISELGEFKTIGLLEPIIADSLNALGASSKLVGVGDDAAVIPDSLLFENFGNSSLLVTTDVMVENRHFVTELVSPESLGWKLLAVSLSDIAAMGGTPRACLVTLQLPASTSITWLKKLYVGLREIASRYNVAIIGGDTVSGSELAFSTTVLGTTTKTSALCSAALRSTAQVGDGVWLSGEVGGSVCGLKNLLRELPEASLGKLVAEARNRHLKPVPRVELGQALVDEGLVHAMIDVSDGLIQDAEHIASCSQVELLIKLESIPVIGGQREPLLELPTMLCGGEDYELLFTARASYSERLIAFSESTVKGHRLPKLTRIGEVIAGAAGVISLETGDGQRINCEDWLKAQGCPAGGGFEHFRAN